MHSHGDGSRLTGNDAVPKELLNGCGGAVHRDAGCGGEVNHGSIRTSSNCGDVFKRQAASIKDDAARPGGKFVLSIACDAVEHGVCRWRRHVCGQGLQGKLRILL